MKMPIASLVAIVESGASVITDQGMPFHDRHKLVTAAKQSGGTITMRIKGMPENELLELAHLGREHVVFDLSPS